MYPFKGDRASIRGGDVLRLTAIHFSKNLGVRVPESIEKTVATPDDFGGERLDKLRR